MRRYAPETLRAEPGGRFPGLIPPDAPELSGRSSLIICDEKEHTGFIKFVNEFTN